MRHGLLVTLSLLSALAGASDHSTRSEAIASADLNSVKAGAYKLEPQHTQIVFSISHFGFTKYFGTFSDASGTLQFDPKNISAAKLEVSIPIQSVSTTSAKLTEDLKGDKWFDATQFPVATFSSTKVARAPDGSLLIVGRFTLHGVSKSMTLKAKSVGCGVNPLNKTFTAGFEASAILKRSDFGIDLYLPGLGDEVTLIIAGAFELT